ncbi:MAG TPA: hypothetical protein VGQ88_00090, partial [Burkholderiales bacterium]|nr:hypothetical protein [Burkholderiales bacterium]
MSSAKRTGTTKNGIERLRTFALCAALLGTACVAHAAATAERVSFESYDIDPQTAQPVTISALFSIASNAAARDDAYMRMKEQLRTA